MTDKKSKLELLLETQHITEAEAIAVIKSSRQKLSQTAVIKIPKQHIRYMYLSDTHIGHNKFSEATFDHMIKYSKKFKPDFIIHPGDHLEGMSHRPGHVYELNEIGFSNQMNKAVGLYSQFEGIPIYGIDGNHDQWYFAPQNAGVCVGDELEMRVKGYKNLGQDEGRLEFAPGKQIMLFHGNDGTAYAECFDDKTEIMTENGWKLFKDITKDEMVATLNISNNQFEWQLPTSYTEEQYDDILLSFQSRSVDMVVTPNHRMLVRKYPKRNNHIENMIMPQKSHRRIDWNWQFKRADSLKGCKQSWQMRRGGAKWIGKYEPFIEIPNIPSKNKGLKVYHFGKLKIEDVAELIAWYVTEGYIRKGILNITQYQKVNPENFQDIINMFKRIGKEPNVKRGRDINIGSVELCTWLLKECGSGSRNKFIPKWLKNQPQEILEILLDVLIRGDGWISHSGFGYTSISKRLLDDVTEIAIKLGYAVTKYNDSISITSQQILPTINHEPEQINYHGKIYCVSVPNTTILVRRNGKIIWSGNSYKLQKLTESLPLDDKSVIIHSGHYHKALYTCIRDKHCFESGTLCEQSKFMRGKKLPARVGFGIVDIWYDKKQSVPRVEISHRWVPGVYNG